MDSIISDNAGFPMTQDFLKVMHKNGLNNRIEVSLLCPRFYMGADTGEIREINAQALRSPFTDKSIRTGKPVLTSGEIRPTDIVPVIAPKQSGKESAFRMKWGFNLPKGSLVVNARIETASMKPAFPEAWEKHLCIISASWYYEWTHLTDGSGREVTGDIIYGSNRKATQ